MSGAVATMACDGGGGGPAAQPAGRSSGQTSTVPRSCVLPVVTGTSSTRWSATKPGPPTTSEYVPGGRESAKRPSTSALAEASRPMTETVALPGAVGQPL